MSRSFADIKRFTTFFCLLATVSIGWIAYNTFATNEKEGTIICIFRRITGIPCPGCGLTRGTICVLNGKIEEAVRYNPLALFVPPFLCATIIAVVFFNRWAYNIFCKAEDKMTKPRNFVILIATILTNWAIVIYNSTTWTI